MLLGSPDRLVQQDDLGPVVVSTIHTVLDQSLGAAAAPLIFETVLMITDTEGRWGDCDESFWYSPTRAAALATHDQVIAHVRHRLLPHTT